MGDGMVQFMEYEGFDDNGPDLILAVREVSVSLLLLCSSLRSGVNLLFLRLPPQHEFGHMIQIANNIFSDLPDFVTNPAERGRFIELQADFIAAYYSIHARGATFRTKRVQDIAAASFAIGGELFFSRIGLP